MIMLSHDQRRSLCSSGQVLFKGIALTMIMTCLLGLSAASRIPSSLASISNDSISSLHRRDITQPDMTVHSLTSSPSRMIYFRNSPHLAYIVDGSDSGIWISKDEGKTWTIIDTIPRGKAKTLLIHPFAQTSTAFVLTESDVHYVTYDAGVSWAEFKTPLFISNSIQSALSFHATQPNRVLFRGRTCEKEDGRNMCHEDTYYTQDHELKDWKPVMTWTHTCAWSQNANPENTDLVDRVVCSRWPPEQQKGDTDRRNPDHLGLFRTSISDANSSIDQIVFGGGVPIFASVTNWMIAVIRLTNGSTQLHTSKDGVTFRKAVFPDSTDLSEQIAYTVLDSSNSSLIVDVVKISKSGGRVSFGDLYKSNSEGSYFVKSLSNTHRDKERGLVDFERLQAPLFEGMMMANVVSNWQRIQNGLDYDAELTSLISFDNGGSWVSLTPPSKDMNNENWPCDVTDKNICALHLQSVTGFRNVGKVFSTTAAPGVLVAVGSVGSKLAPYETCDTFLSEDAGISWKMIAKGPHKFETLNFGSILVLVPEVGAADMIKVSFDRSHSWNDVTIPFTTKGKSQSLYTLTDPDSTSQKMLILTTQSNERQGPFDLVYLDFTKSIDRQCVFDPDSPASSPDFESWQATPRVGECLLGRKVTYFRRKADSVCYVGREFVLPKPEILACDCVDADLECDINFEPDTSSSALGAGGLVCIEQSKVHDQPADCKIGSTYLGVSGYRKIPGDSCQGTHPKLVLVSKTCEKPQRGHVSPPPGMDPPNVSTSSLQDEISQMFHINGSSAAILRTREGAIWISSDNGAHWTLSPLIEKLGAPIVRMGSHDMVASRIFFFTKTDLYVTFNALGAAGGDPHLEELNLPERYNVLDIPVLDFHPDEPDWYVLVLGGRECPDDKKCHTTTYATKDGGKQFYVVDTWTNKCVWAWDAGFKDPAIDKDAIYCLSYQYKDRNVGQDRLLRSPDESNPAQLVLISKDGKEHTTLISKHVSDFYVVSGILVAAVGTSSTPQLHTSLDGQKMVSAVFPPSINIEKLGYTVLPSNTGGVYVNVIQNNAAGKEYGKLFKSNQNGEYFSLSLDSTNTGSNGRVDFDMVHGIDGIVLANMVRNSGSLGIGSEKEIVTRISYDTGVTWSSLVPPKFDSLGNRFPCNNPQRCRLHLHSHADEDKSHGLTAHSIPSSAGLMVGIGNVGDHLTEYSKGSVFITRDGGRSWVEVTKEPHKWAIGNYGGLLLLVNDGKPVNHLKYSWDFGYSWSDFLFSDVPILLERIETNPAPESLQFTISGRHFNPDSGLDKDDHGPTRIIQIDFSQALKRNCVRGEPGSSGSDFEVWEPSQDSPQACFFGQKQRFIRRKADAVCRIGSDMEPSVIQVGSCTCTEQDFECDVNYFRNEVGGCVLYQPDPEAEKRCRSNDGFYESSSGYRKISLSKCSGGDDLQGTIQRPCAQGLNPSNGKPSLSLYSFEGIIIDFMYFTNTQTILARDTELNAYKSHDGGLSWQIVESVKGVTKAIVEDPYWQNRSFILTTTRYIWMTEDGASTFTKIEMPAHAAYSLSNVQLSLHPQNRQWLLWTGIFPETTIPAGYVSFDMGRSWSLLGQKWTECNWGTTKNFTSTNNKDVYCVRRLENGASSFASLYKMVADTPSASVNLYNVSGYAIVDQYLIAAVVSSTSDQPQEQHVQVRVSLNGEKWALGQRERSTPLIAKDGYTVLDSSTGSIFLHVNENLSTKAAHGHVLKSNWNGTFFSQILENVNQNSRGLADFEKVERLPGLLLANQVDLSSSSQSSEKLLLTKMSWDNGASWKRIPAPRVDSQRQVYECGANCFLNLYAYSERHDKRDQYSSSGAVGLMLGVGSIGPYLKAFTDSDTFMSTDAGNTWVEITKDAHMIEVGDHGGVILLANDEEPVDHIKYTLDGGLTFNEIDFNELLRSRKIRVKNIITEPSGTMSHFVLFGQIASGSSHRRREQESKEEEDTFLESKTIAIHLDFTNSWRRACQFLPDTPEKSDFEQWELNPGQCMFGTKTKYYRRKRGHNCQVRHTFEQLPVVVEPCECTIADFECDENYSFIPGTGECKLDAGASPPEPICDAQGFKRYTSGYRKRFLSGCSGGKTLDEPVRIESCSGYGYSHAGKVVGTFFGVFISIGALFILLAWIRHPEKLKSLFTDSYIRLRDDEHETSSPRPVWKAILHKTGILLVGLGGIILVGSQVALDGAYHALDWIRGRMNRSSGYTPLRTTSSSRFHQDADQHLDLNWDDQ